MASTTGHAGNITPYDTMQPKGSVGRTCVTLIDQKTGDAIVGQTAGSVHTYQQGYALTLTPGAAVAVPASVISNDAHLVIGANAAVTLTLPSLAQVLAAYPDLKYGDRFMFMITFDGTGTASNITVASGGGAETKAFPGPIYGSASGQQSTLLVRGYYWYDGAPNNRASLRYGCLWSVDGQGP